ncbi:hypothetical protein DM47_2926 [Burkholderia mallei]|nr:hypothetical protein DM45_3518 [Burkholderia mallei]KOS98243.1 hypothetical protein DM49_3510 [Burkholderia mallei]KOT02274.1 hypothetical protein DM50_3980 [Burkholderia mallei]KOT20132.1 hypothetical protein DM47_2926 [Burkholderia mallei]
MPDSARRPAHAQTVRHPSRQCALNHDANRATPRSAACCGGAIAENDTHALVAPSALSHSRSPRRSFSVAPGDRK